MIKLTIFQPADLPELAYSLPEPQACFARTPQDIFQQYNTLPEGRLPVVIRHNGTPVGFFILDKSEDVAEYSPNPHAVLLRSYSLNPAHQGQGYAKKALSDEVFMPFFRQHFDGADEIVLGVNHANIAAQKLYLSAGFSDSGRRVQGLKGEQYVYVLKINK